MPTLSTTSNGPSGVVITANNAPNGTNLMVEFDFTFQPLVPSAPANTDLTFTTTESPDPSKAGNLSLDFNETTGYATNEQALDAGAVVFDFLIGPPSEYSGVANPNETFTVTVQNISVPDDPPLTYTFTVDVTNQPSTNTPPVAEPVDITSYFAGEKTLNAPAPEGPGLGTDKDGDIVTVSAFDVENQWVFTSTATKSAFGHLTINPFTLEPIPIVVDNGNSALTLSVLPVELPGPGFGVSFIQATILSSLSNQLTVNDAATFKVDYTVGDGHGNYASNVITFQFEGAGTLLAAASSGDVGGTQASGSTASGGLQFTSTIDAMEALAVGYLGGPTDLTTISSWVGQMLSSGLTLSQLAASIATESAVTAEYPFLANPQSATPAQVASFVNSVYENVFERAPTPTELTNAENDLTANLSNSQFVDTFILNLILGAQGPDQTTVTNQIGAAEADRAGLSRNHTNRSFLEPGHDNRQWD